MKKYTIFGSDISLFTRKLEAAFECYGAPFEIKPKTPEIKTALETRAATHQIPVLLTPENWVLADTTPILMMLDGRYPHNRLFPLGVNGVIVHVLEEILDEWMARTMVHFRWHYDENTQFVISKLKGESVDVSTARQHQLAKWGLRACRATGTESVVQQSYAEKEYFGIIAALEEQLAVTPYALGFRPTAVDTILMGSLRGHTNFDPLPDMTGYPRVQTWNSDNKERSNTSTLKDDIDVFDETNPFVDHLIRLAKEQYAPFITGNRQALLNGNKAFTAETYGEEISYLAREYPERSRRMVVQRIQHQLDETERRVVISWLENHGLDHCFSPTS